MNHYDTYKPSGIDWIGDVPSHWEVTKLKHVLSGIQDGTHGTFKSVEVSDYLLLSAKNVFEDGLHFADNERHISKEDYESIVANGFPQFGDIAMCCVGTIGRCYIYDNPTPLAFQRSVTFLRINNKNSNRFILYALKSDIAFSQYSILAKTTAQSGLYMGALASVGISLPPLPEQEAIAAYLDKRCGEIDKVITSQERRIELLREMKQSIITRAVTKGINPNAPMKDSGVEWIGEVPKHWEVKRIKHLKSSAPNAFVDGPFGSNLKSQHFVDDGDVYVIESGMITTGVFVYKDFKTITKEHFETIKRSECKAHDIIIAKIGMNYGMGGELPQLDKPSVVSGNSLKITLDSSKILNSLFVYLLSIAKQTGGYIGLVQETAQPALSLTGLNNFALPVAPIDEQKTIEAYIARKIKPLDAAITKAQREVELLRELKQATITEVVTGKRKVC